MALIEIKELHIHVDLNEVTQIAKKVLHEVVTLKQLTMATFAEIKTEYDGLKSAIAEERAQILAKIQALEDTISAGEGGTAEERSALVDDIKAQIAEVKAIIPDAPTEEPTV